MATIFVEAQRDNTSIPVFVGEQTFYSLEVSVPEETKALIDEHLKRQAILREYAEKLIQLPSFAQRNQVPIPKEFTGEQTKGKQKAGRKASRVSQQVRVGDSAGAAGTGDTV